MTKTSKRCLWVLVGLFGVGLLIYFYLIMPNTSRHSDIEKWYAYDFAHRGLFNDAENIPENSLLAFQKAIDGGYGIELDVQVGKDGIPIIFHDNTLQRICGTDKNITDLTAKELTSYTLSGTTETIPTLEQALSLINGQVPLMVELKVYNGQEYQEICQKTASVLENYTGAYSVISFNPFVLQWFRDNQPETIRGQLSQNFTKGNSNLLPPLRFILTNLLANFLSRPDFISYNYNDTSNVSLTLCHTLFKTPLALWTITDNDTYQRFNPKCDITLFDGFIPC